MIKIRNIKINPFVISGFRWFCGYRFGTHPTLLKIYEQASRKQKRSLRKRFPGIDRNNFGFDRWYPARVIIYGSNGEELATINCRSNEQAKKLLKESEELLTEELNSYKPIKKWTFT